MGPKRGLTGPTPFSKTHDRYQATHFVLQNTICLFTVFTQYLNRLNAKHISTPIQYDVVGQFPKVVKYCQLKQQLFRCKFFCRLDNIYILKI